MAQAEGLDADSRDYLVSREYPLRCRYGLGRVGMAGIGIGIVLGIHVVLLIEGLVHKKTALTSWSSYVLMICVFHTLEFLSTALYKWQDLSYDSFLLNHSKAYSIAMLAACLEYVVEFPWKEVNQYIQLLGFVLCLMGQGIRFSAMYTCGPHFAHRIMIRKDQNHQLVTHGIYSFLRHPSYFGWFYWSIGTQLILNNPICFCAYSFASWSFFADRIPFEERTLLAFYPSEYPQYSSRTYIGIPFIFSPAARVAS